MVKTQHENSWRQEKFILMPVTRSFEYLPLLLRQIFH